MKTEMQKKPETHVGQVKRQRYRRPHYEVSSDENGYDVLVFMPGVSREAATVTLEKGLELLAAREDKLRSQGKDPRAKKKRGRRKK